MNTIYKFKENWYGRDFVLGDLHGCYDLLMDRMKEVNFDKEKDRIFAVGDLVDRGPDNMKCLDLLFEPWFHSVMGNHEDMMFEGLLRLDRGSYQCWVQNGGTWHFKEREKDAEAFEAYIATIETLLPLAFEIDTKEGETIGVLHADPPEFWNEALIRDLKMNTIWGRQRINSKNERPVKDISRVYVGHTPVKEVTTLGNVVYVDTGCNWTGNLTLLEI